MPRFYFHLHNDIEARDDEGTELPDVNAARVHAVKLVRFEAAEAVKRASHFVGHHRIDIANVEGQVLETVRFSDVVKIEA